jgi:hypothetical protein
MAIVLGIRHGFEVLGIAPRTSHIFGWTSSLSGEKPWIGRLGLSVDYVLEPGCSRVANDTPRLSTAAGRSLSAGLERMEMRGDCRHDGEWPEWGMKTSSRCAG